MIRLLEHAVRRLVPLLLLPLAFPATLARGQTEGEGFLVHRGTYVPTVRCERERALLRAYRAASAEARETARKTLLAGRAPGAPELQPPDLEVLAAATRALSGADPARGSWQDFADSIDLRVVPGAFEAREDGLGEYTTVHFSRLWEVGLEGDVVIALLWVSGDGRELPVRREKWPAKNIRDGLEMYIRPPASAAGRWELVAELHTPGGVARTGGVPVDCVSGLYERGEALQAAGSSFLPPLRKQLVARLRPLLAYGVRDADALPLQDWFALGAREPIDAPLRPVVLPGFGDGLADIWELLPKSEEPPSEAVLILTSRGEHPTDLLVGASREVWSAFQDRTGRRVLIATLPNPSTVGPGASLFIDELRSALGIRHLVVVASGQNGMLMPHSLKIDVDHGVDALVLAATPAARVAPQKPLGIPLLLVHSEAKEVGRATGVGPAGGPWTRVSLTEPPLLAALKIPELVAEWLDQS